MCILLPIEHMPCKHTVSVLQPCFDAPRVSIEYQTPCSNARQHDRPILLSKPCLDCGRDRFFAGKGAFTGYGNGSRPSTPYDTDDSGYQSGFNNEDEEESDLDDVSIPSPSNAETRPHKRSSSDNQQLNAKAELKLKLKDGFMFGGIPTNRLRRDSIDSITSNINETAAQQQISMESEVNTTSFIKTRRPSTQSLNTTKPYVVRRKQSTLLHPSTPALVTPTSAQSPMMTFSFPQLVDTQRTSTGRRVSDAQKSMTMRPRKDSTLLHPSRTTTPTTNFTQYKTILSVPPTRHDQEEGSIISSMIQSFPSPPTARKGPTSTPPRMQVNATSNIILPQQRRPSVLHSSLSDTEDEGFDEPMYNNTLHFRSMRNEYVRDKAVDSVEPTPQNNKEGGAVLGGAARVARAIRRRIRPTA